MTSEGAWFTPPGSPTESYSPSPSICERQAPFAAQSTTSATPEVITKEGLQQPPVVTAEAGAIAAALAKSPVRMRRCGGLGVGFLVEAFLTLPVTSAVCHIPCHILGHVWQPLRLEIIDSFRDTVSEPKQLQFSVAT